MIYTVIAVSDCCEIAFCGIQTINHELMFALVFHFISSTV